MRIHFGVYDKTRKSPDLNYFHFLEADYRSIAERAYALLPVEFRADPNRPVDPSQLHGGIIGTEDSCAVYRYVAAKSSTDPRPLNVILFALVRRDELLGRDWRAILKSDLFNEMAERLRIGNWEPPRTLPAEIEVPPLQSQRLPADITSQRVFPGHEDGPNVAEADGGIPKEGDFARVLEEAPNHSVRSAIRNLPSSKSDTIVRDDPVRDSNHIQQVGRLRRPAAPVAVPVRWTLLQRPLGFRCGLVVGLVSGVLLGIAGVHAYHTMSREAAQAQSIPSEVREGNGAQIMRPLAPATKRSSSGNVPDREERPPPAHTLPGNRVSSPSDVSPPTDTMDRSEP